jgi:serine O-acetyltransferase
MTHDVWALIRADAMENLDRRLGTAGVVAAVLASRGVRAAALYRVAHELHRRRHRLAALLTTRLNLALHAVDIHYEVTAGPGLVLRHAFGVVVGREAQLGSRVRLFQHVTLGKRMSGSTEHPDGMPTLGDDVHVYAGAVIVGPITVGERSLVGANVVLTESCPPDSTVVAPASRIVEPRER